MVDAVPVLVGLLTWVTVHSALTDALVRGRRRPDLESRERRVFLVVAGAVAVASVGIGVAGRFVGAGRRHVETSRRLLRIPGVTRREAPAATSLGVRGIAPWQTPNEDFYLIDTTIAVPTIEPEDWSLRIHGLVDRELTLSYADLVARQMTESWVTLACVSNEVGGGLVGNARWSGVRIADLLADLGVSAEADCVLQTSHDGWSCATPLSTLTDDRDAMLAVAMNGRPLPIEHGFPVRTVVPGLYGYVSATKWVVDYEVSTFANAVGYWTTKGWSAEGPVKLASRIDVPRSGDDVRRRRGHVRRRRLAPAHRHRRRGGAGRRWAVGARRARRGAVGGHVGPVGRDPRRGRGRPRGAGAGDRQGRRHPDQRRAGPGSGRVDRAAHDRDQRLLTSQVLSCCG